MAPDRAKPRGPAAARGPCPRGSQGAERRFRVPPSGMKAAASASRRSRAAERQRLGCSRRQSPVQAPRRTAAVGLAQGAVPRRCDPFSLGGGFMLQHFCEGGERRARSFNTEKDAAGVISLCPGGSAASSAVPPPSSHTRSFSLSPDLPSTPQSASSSQLCTIPYSSGLFCRGSSGARGRFRALTRGEENPGRLGVPRDSEQRDRDEPAPLRSSPGCRELPSPAEGWRRWGCKQAMRKARLGRSFLRRKK